MLQRIGLGESVAVEIFRAVAEVARERFFHNGELVPLKSGDCNRLMSHRRRADVNNIHLIEKLFQTVEGTNPTFLSIRCRLFCVCGEYSFDLNVCAVDLLQTFEMKRRGEACTNNSRTNGFLFHLCFPF